MNRARRCAAAVMLGTVPFVGTAHAQVEPRVPAYTAYLSPNPDAVRVSANRPLTPFTTAGTSLTWYGHRTSREQLSAAIALTLPAHDTVTLELIVRTDLKREVHRAATTGTGAEQRLTFGDFFGQDTGYVQFELRLRDQRATSNVAVNTLLLSGPGASGAHFNTDAASKRRQRASALPHRFHRAHHRVLYRSHRDG